MLGIEQFNDDGVYAYSARSASDVLIYLFPAIEFEALVLKYPYARRFVSAYGKTTGDFSAADGRRGPHGIFLQDVAGRESLLSGAADLSIREAVRKMRDSGADSIVILDSEKRPLGVLTADNFLKWIDEGGGDPHEPVSSLVRSVPLSMAPNASVTDGVLAMGSSGATAVILTSDGTSKGSVHGVITSRDLEPVFGDQPVSILRDIPIAADVHALRDINKRARSFALQQLTSAASVEWLARFTAQLIFASRDALCRSAMPRIFL
jgi:CBS domain-containing protein